MKTEIEILFKDVYEKLYKNKEGIEKETFHQDVNGVIVYINSYKESEDFFSIKYAGIELNKNGKIIFDEYSSFDDRQFYLSTFIDFIRQKVIDGVNDDCDTLYFFSYQKKTENTVPKVSFENDKEYKVKADILDKLLDKKLTIG